MAWQKNEPLKLSQTSGVLQWVRSLNAKFTNSFSSGSRQKMEVRF
jgi:hypothetical protein